MSPSFLLAEGLDAGDVEMLWILAAAFSPGIIGLLLMVFALWLPDHGYIPSQRLENRQRKPHHANDDNRDWRRAA